MQGALEQESRGKAEALRMKKKLEADVAELDVSLEHANAANIETQKTIKQYHSKIRDAQAKLEDEQRAKEVTRDHLLACERKANTAQNALEKLVPCLSNQTGHVVSLNRNSLTPMNNSQ